MALLRFLYAVQNYPDLILACYFKEVECLQRELLWDGRPCIALQKLALGWYDWGEIGLPDIRKYYWAAHLAASDHCTYRCSEDPGYRMDK